MSALEGGAARPPRPSGRRSTTRGGPRWPGAAPREWLAALSMGVLVAVWAAPAPAVTVLFDGRWREGGWLSFGSDAWGRHGDRLSVGTEGAEGPVWRLLPETLWDARRASWRWGVARRDSAEGGVEGAGRTLTVRFVFAPRDAARRLSESSARRASRTEVARSLIYVWGGAGRPGAIALSEDGRTAAVTRRQGGTGAAREAVDLAADYERAFGGPAPALVALGVSADASGAGGPIEAAVADLTLD